MEGLGIIHINTWVVGYEETCKKTYCSNFQHYITKTKVATKLHPRMEKMRVGGTNNHFLFFWVAYTLLKD
jgi:hypothetical protein